MVRLVGVEDDRGRLEFLRKKERAEIGHGIRKKRATVEATEFPEDASNSLIANRYEKEAPLLAVPLFRLIKLQTTN